MLQKKGFLSLSHLAVTAPSSEGAKGVAKTLADLLDCFLKLYTTYDVIST